VSRTVIVRLAGGLGNQLFQFAAGCYLRTHKELNVRFDDSWYHDPGRGGATPRAFELGALLADAGFELHRPRFARLKYHRWNPTTLLENEPSASALDDLAPRIHSLQGYFQVARYPLGVQTELARYLLPVLDRIPPIEGVQNAVGVHVRLGDYATDLTAAAYHGQTGPQYCGAAVRAARSSAPGGAVVVFTDSPELARRDGYLDEFDDATNVVHERTAWETLADLSNCAAIVMSNSSLSWWAAFTANALRSRDMTVVYPVPWLAKLSAADSSLPLPGWTPMSRATS